MYSSEELERLAFGCHDMGLGSIWANLDANLSNDLTSFRQRSDAFLWVLERLLRADRIKLSKHGRVLEGAIEEQVDAFRRAWPQSELDADRRSFPDGSPYIGSNRGMGVWFYMDDCPANEVIWRQPDGSLPPIASHD